MFLASEHSVREEIKKNQELRAIALQSSWFKTMTPERITHLLYIIDSQRAVLQKLCLHSQVTGNMLTKEWAADILGIPRTDLTYEELSAFQQERIACLLAGAVEIIEMISGDDLNLTCSIIKSLRIEHYQLDL